MFNVNNLDANREMKTIINNPSSKKDTNDFAN